MENRSGVICKPNYGQVKFTFPIDDNLSPKFPEADTSVIPFHIGDSAVSPINAPQIRAVHRKTPSVSELAFDVP
jgi:hypothetical protein